MSSTVGSRSGNTGGSKKYVNFDELVAFQLEKARSGIRGNDLLMGAVGLGVFLAAYLFVFLVLDHWVFAEGVGTGLRIALWLGIVAAVVAWIAWKVAVPYLRRVSSLFAAKEIEQTHPGLKSSLLTLVDLREAGRPVSPQILQAIEKRAAVSLSDLDIDHAIDRRSLMRWSYVLLGIVAIICVYTMLTPKRLGPSLLRALIPVADIAVGTQTRIEKVTPGDVSVLSRSQVTIETQLTGRIPPEVKVLYSTDDRRFVDEPLVLNDTGENLNRFRGTLTGERGKGLLQGLTYRVVAGDAISPRYTITVTQPPSATVQDVAYDYPAYMGLEDRTQANPTIDAWEGTAITLRAVANRPVTVARVLFSDSEDTSIKAEEVAMKIEDGIHLTATWPLQFRSDGTYPHFYRLHVETSDGSRDPQPTLFPLKIRQDLAPTVQIIHPASDVNAPANGAVQVAWQAADPDFQLSNVLIRYEKKGQELVEVDPLFESPPYKATAKGVSSIDLKRFDVRPGDKLTFWLEARDNLQPFGNRQPNLAKSPRINISIVDPVDEQQAEKGAEQEKQQAQEKLDQAPPPPQENRANPDEGQQQPEDKQDNQPQDGNPQQGADGNQKKPGDPMRGMGEGDPQNMSEDGMGEQQPGNPQQGPGEQKDPMTGNDPKQGPKEPGKGKGQPQRGTPQEQSPDQPQNSDDPMMGEGQEKEGSTGNPGQTGSKPGKPGSGQKNPMSQPQREPQMGDSESESNPQEQDPGREGSSGGKGRNDKNKGGEKQRGESNGGEGRQDKASEDEALNKLLDYDKNKKRTPREEPEPPRENESPSNSGSSGRSPMSDRNPGDAEKPEAGPMNDSNASPMNGSSKTDKGDKGNNTSGMGSTGSPMEKTPGDKTEKGTGEKRTPDGASKDPSKGPNEKAAGEKGTGGTDSGMGMNEPGRRKPGEMPEPTASETGNKGPMNGGPMDAGKPEKGRPGAEDPARDKPMPGTGQDNKRPGNPDPNKTPMEAPSDQGTGSAPKPSGMNEPKQGEGAGSKPQSGPKGTSGDAEKNMGSGNPMSKEGETGGSGKPNEADQNMTDPTSKSGPGQGAGEKQGMKNTPKPEGGTGAKPGDNADPMNGAGAKPPMKGDAGGGEAGKEGDPMAPMNGRGNDDGTGTKPRTGEKPKPGEGRPGGENTGQTKPVQRKPNPMGGTDDEPSVDKSDPRTQQSQDPMKGMSGQSADASEGNAGGDQKGPGDTTKRPGKDGSGKPADGASKDPKNPKAPNPNGASGTGEKSDDPMQGAGTRPGGKQNGVGGEKTDDAGGKPMRSETGEETSPEAGAKGPKGGGKPGKTPGESGEEGAGGEKPMSSGDAGSDAQEGSNKQPGGEQGRKPSEGGSKETRKPGDNDPMSGSKPAGDKGNSPMQRGAPKPGGEPMQGGEQPGSDKGGEMPPGGDQAGQPMDSGMGEGKPEGPAGKPSGNQPGQGGGPGGEAPPEGKRTEATQPGQGDEGTDLENKKKAVNLMLKRLQDELRRGETDPELLKELGFNETELQQFLKRVDQQLNSEDTSPEAVARRRQFEEFLKGLDSQSSGETRGGGEGPREATGGFGARNSVPPSEYAREAEAYKKRLSKKPGARPATKTP